MMTGMDAPRLIVLDRTHEATGVVGPGESWWAAAQRTTALAGFGRGAGELVPRDLSGDPQVWAIEHHVVVVLRPMSRGDLPDLVRWRSADHVLRWFRGACDLDAVTELYGPRIDGTTTTTMWVVEVNGRSIGFCQDYLVRDHPEYAVLTPDPEALAVDYVVGVEGLTGHGLGTRMLWAWLVSAHRRHPDVTAYFASPDHRNTASIRVLEKVGFVRGTWFDEPQADGTVDTMVGCSLDVRTVLG